MDIVRPTGPPPTITTGTSAGGDPEAVDHDRRDHHVVVSRETRRVPNGDANAARHATGCLASARIARDMPPSSCRRRATPPRRAGPSASEHAAARLGQQSFRLFFTLLQNAPFDATSPRAIRDTPNTRTRVFDASRRVYRRAVV
jgi:hypothetical protein